MSVYVYRILHDYGFTGLIDCPIPVCYNLPIATQHEEARMNLTDLVEWNGHSEELTSEDVFADEFPFHCVEAESEDSEGNPVHVWSAYVGDGYVFDWFSGASARKTTAGGGIWLGAVSWHRAPDGTWTGPGAEELGARNLDGMFKDLLAASRSQKKRTK